MNFKFAIAGGIGYYVTTFLVSFVTGPLIHNTLLTGAYKATAASWRPELMSNPPDIGALLPYWAATGALYGAVFATLYLVVRPALTGAAALRGAKYGLGIGLLLTAVYISFHGFFNFPFLIWGMWSLEAVIMQAAAGAVIGLLAEKLAPSEPARGT